MNSGYGRVGAGDLGPRWRKWMQPTTGPASFPHPASSSTSRFSVSCNVSPASRWPPGRTCTSSGLRMTSTSSPLNTTPRTDVTCSSGGSSSPRYPLTHNGVSCSSLHQTVVSSVSGSLSARKSSRRGISPPSLACRHGLWQKVAQETTRVGRLDAGYVFGCADSHDLPPTIAAFGTEVYNVV